MKTSGSGKRDPVGTRERLVGAMMELVRRQGYHGTTVEAVCEEAGLTKGAFFHHFRTKEDLGEAAVLEWCRCGMEMYMGWLGASGDDPLVRLDRLFDGMIGMSAGEEGGDGEPVSCVLGMVSQEMSGTHEGMRGVCHEGLVGWTRMVEGLLEEGKRVHSVRVDFRPEEVGWMLNSLWQGAMLVAKALRDPGVIVGSLRHARAYVNLLFTVEGRGMA